MQVEGRLADRFERLVEAIESPFLIVSWLHQQTTLLSIITIQLSSYPAIQSFSHQRDGFAILVPMLSPGSGFALILRASGRPEQVTS